MRNFTSLLILCAKGCWIEAPSLSTSENSSHTACPAADRRWCFSLKVTLASNSLAGVKRSSRIIVFADLDPDERPAQAAVFATTHWSVVLAAGHSSSPQANEALEKLCKTYWYPLYVYLRRSGRHTHDA